MPISNVFTIKENSVSTHPFSTKHNIPNNYKEQVPSPFARSQSFNNYTKYRNNIQNNRSNFQTNEGCVLTSASDTHYSNNGAFNLQTVHTPSPCCVWGQPQPDSLGNIPNITFQTQNNVNTNTTTQFAPSEKLPLNSLSSRPWSVRRSDSFSPGNMSQIYM